MKRFLNEENGTQMGTKVRPGCHLYAPGNSQKHEENLQIVIIGK